MSQSDYVLNVETIIPAPLEKVFPFFSKPENLELLTPNFLKFRIISMPSATEKGVQIRYRLRIHHFPVQWLSEISVWEPPRRFVDTQLKGSYKKWIHEHRFEALDGKTRMTDTVHYQLPFGILGRLAHGLFVRRDIEKIFQYRQQVIQQYFTEEKDDV